MVLVTTEARAGGVVAGVGRRGGAWTVDNAVAAGVTDGERAAESARARHAGCAAVRGSVIGRVADRHRACGVGLRDGERFIERSRRLVVGIAWVARRRDA